MWNQCSTVRKASYILVASATCSSDIPIFLSSSEEFVGFASATSTAITVGWHLRGTSKLFQAPADRAGCDAGGRGNGGDAAIPRRTRLAAANERRPRSSRCGARATKRSRMALASDHLSTLRKRTVTRESIQIFPDKPLASLSARWGREPLAGTCVGFLWDALSNSTSSATPAAIRW